MDIETFLNKHGLPTWGTELDKRIRAERNGWEEDMKMREVKMDAQARKSLLNVPMPLSDVASAIPAPQETGLVAGLVGDTISGVGVHKPRRGRPPKVKASTSEN